MQETSANPLENFLNAKYLLKHLTGITMTDEDFIELAYRAYRKIGNIAVATHIHKDCVKDGIINLPCNVEFIESLATGDYYLDQVGDIIYSSEGSNGLKVSQYYYPDILNLSNMNRINLSRTELHPTGQFVPYEIIGKNEYLKIGEMWEGQKLTLTYKGQILDEDGLPALTAKEVEAIAYYVAYLDVQKRIFMKEPGMMDMFTLVKAQYPRALQAAKIPEHLSQNFWDQLLSANTRFDRKQFGSSYKLIR